MFWFWIFFPWQYLKASHGLMKSISLRLVMNVQYLKVWLTFSLFPLYFFFLVFFVLSAQQLHLLHARWVCLFKKTAFLKRKKGCWFCQQTAPNTNASTFLTISGVRCRWIFLLFERTWNFLTFFFFFAWLSQAVKCCCQNCAGLSQKWPCGFVKRQTKKKIKTSTRIIWCWQWQWTTCLIFVWPSAVEKHLLDVSAVSLLAVYQAGHADL